MSVRGFYLKRRPVKINNPFTLPLNKDPDLLHEKEIHSTYGYRRVPNRMS